MVSKTEAIDPRHLLVKVVDILHKLNIPYVVTGGMAIFVWGRPRFTADIDEDLILSKLIWQKESGSELQLKDVELVLKMQKNLTGNIFGNWLRYTQRIKH